MHGVQYRNHGHERVNAVPYVQANTVMIDWPLYWRDEDREEDATVLLELVEVGNRSPKLPGDK